jgi:Fe2+ or Zn2+ uptake regulation protein
MTVDDQEPDLRARLYADGGRLTSQLVHVRRVLEDADEHHLSSRMVHERLLTALRDTPISTVYRALARLERIGVVHSLQVESEMLYGLSTPSHHHAWCVDCGSLAPVPTAHVHNAVRELERLTGMTQADANGLLMRGRCAECSGR